ncbi:rubrerythrin family protein [Streptomyces sp. RY43-2]|uniref:Rubrerythrin family protein n=1 Tax=Streptomyces macrolidinus TaxID=2952607 RepID=A0ABT0ZM45_9ACTN|nr:ferritin family protein [Streptomyces macrolidinus]MCN9244651.1 rubrerythrin family protein [Streptomyces macrolidinus]
MFRHSIRTLLVGLCSLTAVSQATTAVAAALPADQQRAAHTAAGARHSQTVSDLATVVKGEAFAYASYGLLGTQADREAHPAIGRLFRTTMQSGLNENLRRAATLAGMVGGNAANLRQAIEGESYEHQVMYRGFADQARKDGDLEAARLFTELAADEGRHRDAYRTALTVVTTGRGTIPAPPKADVVSVPAGLPKVKAARTRANLDTAMHGEALAHAKYMLFAAHARQTGNPALARLFEGTAGVELHEHFAGEAVLAGLVRTTKTNLRQAVIREHDNATTLYPMFAKRATAVGDTAAARCFREMTATAAKRAAAFQQALDQMH